MTNREAMKSEAIKRMKSLNYFSASIVEFDSNDLVMVNEPPLGAHYYVSGEAKTIVDDFEKENEALVYAVIHCFTEFGELYNLLYVSNHTEEWGIDNEDLANCEPLVYVANVDCPDCSEFGCIGIKKTCAGGLQRIW